MLIFNARLQGTSFKNSDQASIKVLDDSSPMYTCLKALSATQGTKKPERRVVTINEMKPNVHCDLKVRVKSMYTSNVSTQVSIVVCDHIKDINIVMWDENAELGKQLVVGDYVHLKNVHPRTNRDGILEGFMHGDPGSRKPKILKLAVTDQVIRLIQQCVLFNSGGTSKRVGWIFVKLNRYQRPAKNLHLRHELSDKTFQSQTCPVCFRGNAQTSGV